MRISVIIPTRNRAERLRRCLQSLVEQSASPESFEVVVVDNGSTDHTRSVADEFSSRLQLQYVFAAEPGLHVGRHCGMRHARAPLLVYGEDDIEALPGWIAAILDNFDCDPDLTLLGGNLYPNFEAEPPAWLRYWWSQRNAYGRALGYLGILDFGEGRFPVDPAYVWGGNFAVRRETLLAVGGFHPDGVPQERILFRGDGESHTAAAIHRIGGKVMFDSRASVRHLVAANRMNAEYLEKRAFNQGISESYRVIRRCGGLQLPLREWVHVFLRPRVAEAWFRMKGMVARDPAALEFARIRSRTVAAYARGLAFHRKNVARDRALLNWVLKENYLV